MVIKGGFGRSILTQLVQNVNLWMLRDAFSCSLHSDFVIAIHELKIIYF
jgi:hypothetical protein